MAARNRAGAISKDRPDRFYYSCQGDPNYFERVLRQEWYERCTCGNESKELVRRDVVKSWEDTVLSIWQSCKSDHAPEPVIWTR